MKGGKNKMNKKLMIFGIVGLFAVTLVAAGYVVNNFVLKVDVAEPFEVSYAIVGDAGNPAWQVASSCSDIADGEYIDLSQLSQPVDFSYIYAGESRKFCVLIDNKAENTIPYRVESDVVAGHGNHADCVYAFGEIIFGGDAAPGISKQGVDITVPGDAAPVDDCEVEVSVARG